MFALIFHPNTFNPVATPVIPTEVYRKLSVLSLVMQCVPSRGRQWTYFRLERTAFMAAGCQSGLFLSQRLVRENMKQCRVLGENNQLGLPLVPVIHVALLWRCRWRAEETTTRVWRLSQQKNANPGKISDKLGSGFKIKMCGSQYQHGQNARHHFENIVVL